jgi:hypothetical protein
VALFLSLRLIKCHFVESGLVSQTLFIFVEYLLEIGYRFPLIFAKTSLLHVPQHVVMSLRCSVRPFSS